MLAGCLLLAGACLGYAAGAEAERIELTDGTVVNGEVTSLRDGIYTIRTQSLGTLMVDESGIRSIHLAPGGALPEDTSPPAPVPAAPPGLAASPLPDMGTLQTRILNDDRMMQSIRALQNDPEIMKIIQDPAIMQALLAGNVNALMADPRFMKLMNHPGLKRIQQDLAGSGADR